MHINELAFRYNKELNPKLWNSNETLKPRVKAKLNEIADKFVEFLDIDLDITDIIITGSSANYNWTNESDIDLHIVIDKTEYADQCSVFTDAFFTDKKTIWNEHHDIEIYGHPVELYVQDKNEPHIATGVYSLMEEEWLIEPEYSPPSVDEMSVEAKTKQLMKLIDLVVETDASYDDAKKIKHKIGRYRKAGLNKAGEFSTENLVFKELRRNGYLEKLRDFIRKSFVRSLSLY